MAKITELGKISTSVSETFDLKDTKEVIFLNTSDILEGQFLNNKKVNTSNLPGQAKKKIKIKDILFSEIRPINKRYALVNFQPTDYVVSTKLMVLRASNEMLPEYLYYFLTSEKILHEFQILAESRSGTFPQITFESIYKTPIILHTIKYQEKCVKIISSIDKKIELNNKINSILQQISQLLFKHWFIDFEFPNEQGQPYKSSGGEFIDLELGKIPKGWEVIKFSDEINIFDFKRIPISSRERAKRKGIFPYYGATGIIDYIDSYIFDGVYVLIGEDGSVIREDGRPFTQYVCGKFWVNNHAHIIQGKNNYSTEYVKLLLDFINIYPYITGAVQLKLNQDNLLNIKLISSSEKILKLFNSVVGTIFKNLIILTNQNITLNTLRDSLLPKLISGRIRVNLEDIEES